MQRAGHGHGGRALQQGGRCHPGGGPGVDGQPAADEQVQIAADEH